MTCARSSSTSTSRIARPGPELGPEGYRRLGERFGLELDPARYAEAREAAVEGIKRHPELEHDEEIWVAFTERIIRGMGGDADSAVRVRGRDDEGLGARRALRALRGRAARARGAARATG